jgi:hypothetical protein
VIKSLILADIYAGVPMKTNKDLMEKLFPSVYITLISILLGFAVEDVVTQLRALAPIGIYPSLSAIGILSALIAGWISFSFVSITQVRLPKLSDALTVFFLAFSWYLMSSTLGLDIWWFFCAISIFDLMSTIAVIYTSKVLVENISTQYDSRIFRWNLWVLIPSLMIYPVAAWMSVRELLPFGVEIALIIYFPIRNALWILLFFKVWKKLISEMA